MGILRSTIKFGVKAYIAWFAVDYTIEEGFWSDSNGSIEAFKTVKKNIKDITPEYIKSSIPEILNLNGMDLTNNWNGQVHNASEFILKSPKNISNLINENLFSHRNISNMNVK